LAFSVTCNPWVTPYPLWRAKTGSAEQPVNAAMTAAAQAQGPVKLSASRYTAPTWTQETTKPCLENWAKLLL
jgi:hypothetical protein